MLSHAQVGKSVVIAQQVQGLAATRIRVVLAVATGADIVTVIEEAVVRGVVGEGTERSRCWGEGVVGWGGQSAIVGLGAISCSLGHSCSLRQRSWQFASLMTPVQALPPAHSPQAQCGSLAMV